MANFSALWPICSLLPSVVVEASICLAHDLGTMELKVHKLQAEMNSILPIVAEILTKELENCAFPTEFCAKIVSFYCIRNTLESSRGAFMVGDHPLRN